MLGRNIPLLQSTANWGGFIFESYSEA